jgi:hypothetical protein
MTVVLVVYSDNIKIPYLALAEIVRDRPRQRSHNVNQ